VADNAAGSSAPIEHDALRGSLADAGDGQEACVVAERNRPPKLARRRSRHHRQSDLGTDAVHGQQLREELPLLPVRESVQLQHVLAHVEVRLERDLAGAFGAAQCRRRRGEQVADTVDVEHDPVGRAAGGPPAQPRDHGVLLTTRP
jgi:hypothetical protein